MRYDLKIWMRMLSLVLALCITLGMVAVPGVTIAHASGAEAASILSEHVYYHNMNEKLSNGAPVNWSRSSGSQNAKGSAIVESSGRTYLQLKRDGTESVASSYFQYQDATNFDTSCVLKYELMVDNTESAAQDHWTILIPALSHAAKTQPTQISIKKLDGDAKNYLYIGTEEVAEWTPGKWYTVEQVYDGTSVHLYLDGTYVATGTHDKEALGYIVMGIFAKNNSSDPTLTVTGEGVGMNLDELCVYDYVAGTGFAAGASSYEVAVGDTVTPVWTKAPSNAYLPAVTYTSSNEAVAIVDSVTGVVTGVSEGQATITATPAKSSGLLAASVNVLVAAESAPAITGVQINGGADKATVEVDKTLTLTATVLPAEATEASVTWTTSDDTVASVNATTGIVTGVMKGTATITATVDGTGISDTIIVEVTAKPDSQGALIASNSMDTSGTNALYPLNWTRTGQHSNGSSFITDGGRTYYRMKRDGTEGAAVSWLYTIVDSDYESVALKYDVMIDNGSMTGWSVFLPAFTDNNKQRPIAITVKDNALQGTDVTLEAGRWYTVEIILVDTAWSLYVDGVKVSEGTIAEDKTIACINMGISNVGGNPAEGQSAGANVAMNIDNFAVYNFAAATGFAFEKTQYEVLTGKTIQTKWILQPNNAYLPFVTFESSDKAVATVDENGVVTGISEGEAIITATPAPSTGLSAVSATVVVRNSNDHVSVSGVVINETNVSVRVGDTTSLTATITPDNATVKSVTWTSDNTAVATVDAATGLVTGVSVGTAQITVTTDDGGKTATVTVTVEPVSATGVTINDGVEAATVTAGKSITLHAAVTPSGASNSTVIWSSNNPAIATVDANTGVVVGVQEGTVVITATVDGTLLTDTITVLVTAPRTESCAEAIYENTMDVLNSTGSTQYPEGWTRESQTATASSIVTAGGRTYWQMKNSPEGITASAYALYTFKDALGNDSPLAVTPVSMKYSVMVDNGDETYTTYLPAFTNAKRSRLFVLNIANGELKAGSVAMEVENGRWYDVEVVLDGDCWRVYVDGSKFASGTLETAVTSVAYINAGIYGKQSAGKPAKNINISIDNLTVHAHDACVYNTYKNVAFEADKYRHVGATSFTPALKNLPSGASVKYISDNETVATVTAAGVVTLTGVQGLATISAIVDGCTIPVATTTVECAGKFYYSENFDNGLNGWKVRIHCGDSNYYSLSQTEIAGNGVMAMKQVAQSGNSSRAVYSFENGLTLDRAVISYDFMIEESMGVVYLPGFINGTSKMVGQVMISYGRLSRMTADGWGAMDLWIAPDTWYTLEQVVDTVAGVYDLYINGQLVLSQEPIADNNVAFNGLYIGMYKITTNTQYIDNILVTEGIDPVESVSFKQSSYEAVVGGATTVLETVATPAERNFRTVKYTSSDPSVATVDAYGNVTALKAGTVTITAVPYGNTSLQATTTLTVIEKPIIAIDASDITLRLHGHQYLKPTIAPVDAGHQDLLYSSSNTAVVTVDEWGELVAVGKGTAQVTITADKYPDITKTITVTVTDAVYQGTIYVSVNGGGDGTSKNSPMTLDQAMAAVAAMDKSSGSVVVELAAGYYKRTEALNFTAAHGGVNDNFVIFRAASGANVTIGGAEILDDEIVSGFTQVSGEKYYVMQLNKDINTRHLLINGVRAVRARSNQGLTDPQLITSESGLAYLGFSSTDTFLLEIPEDDQEDLEFSYSVEWANHRGGVTRIEDAGEGRINIIMEQPNFQSLVAHSNISIKDLVNPSRPYSMFYENALMLLDEPGEWYFDNEEMKLYYMPYAWENVEELTISYPIIDDWTNSGETESDSGLINILGDGSSIVQNIKFEGIIFADTTYNRVNTNVGMSASQGMHIRDYNSTSADVMPDAAITLYKANSIYFTGCTFTRLGITGINMFMGSQNVQINGCVFSDISGNGMYIGQTNWRDKEIYNPSDPLMVVKNCDVYNSYIHDIGTEYNSASAIGIGFAAYVNVENNEIFNVDYSPLHIGLGWTAEIDNVLRHTTVANNFIHDFNQGGVWDSGGIYVNGTTSGNLDPFTGTGTNLISGNYLRNMGVGTAALYNDGGSDNWIWEYNVVDLSESPLWHNAYTPNGAQWLTVSTSNSPCLVRYNYSSHTKTRRGFPSASGASYKVQGPYNEDQLNDNNLGLVFKGNVICEDLNWPTEARNIMAASGLPAAYAYLRNNHAERLVTDFPSENGGVLVFAVGETYNINLRATDGKDAAVDMSGVTVAYASTDESVITVSADGVITAVGKGDAVVRVYVLSNNLVQVVEAPISVGVELVDISLNGTNSDGNIELDITGGALALVPQAITERGIYLTPEKVNFAVANAAIVEVDAEGNIKPLNLGSTTLTVSVFAKGQQFTKTFNVNVIRPTSFVLDDLAEIYQRTSLSQWNSLYSKITIDQDRELRVELTNTGFTTFRPTKYMNELFCFEFTMTKNSAWPSFVLRSQDSYTYVSSGATGYLVSFTNTGVQLQRFNGRDRTVLYGSVEGFDPLYGGDIPFYLNNGQRYRIQLGSLTSGGNVWLYLSVNGQVIFSCLDKGYGAITNSGYFGVVGKKGDVFTFTKATNLSSYSLPSTSYIEKEENEVMEGTPTVEEIPEPEKIIIAQNPNGQPTRPSKADKDDNGSADDGANNNNNWLLPVLIASGVAIAAIIIILIIILKKKSKKQAPETKADPKTKA